MYLRDHMEKSSYNLCFVAAFLFAPEQETVSKKVNGFFQQMNHADS